MLHSGAKLAGSPKGAIPRGRRCSRSKRGQQSQDRSPRPAANSSAGCVSQISMGHTYAKNNNNKYLLLK